MPPDQLLLLTIGLVLIAGVAIAVAYATTYAAKRGASDSGGGRRLPDPGGPGLRELSHDGEPRTGPASEGRRGSSLFMTPTSTRQVARVVAFLFLASVAVVTALTRAWPDNEPAIFTLVAAGTLLVVLFMDMVPPAALGRARRPVEGVGAIVFLGLLTGLSGGASSPFLLGFFLVVAGTALSVEGLAPLVIAILAATTIAFVGVVVAGWDALAPLDLAWIGFSAVALILLADIATAAARAQRQARDDALRASRFDALTGLFNRAFFFTTMEQEIRRSDRMGRGFTMLMLDIDDLKPVNDTFGHQWGDRLLRAVADVVRHTIRFTDSAARYGGDEFVVLLPETDAAGGYVVGEKLRRDIAALTLQAADRDVRSSVSVGLVSYPTDGTTIEQLVAAADVAMYESKRRGKNRIVGYQTRTERVATDIDADSNRLVQLGSDDDARTGGDAPPWWSGSELRPVMDPQPILEPLREPWRRTDPAPIESARGRRRYDDEPSRPTDEPGRPAPPTQRGDAGARPAPRETDETPPWVTRTIGSVTEPRESRRAEGPAEPSDPPPRRPAADARSSGRQTSRRNEIRGEVGDRPWIALPIEPYDPPERPKGQA